MIPTKQQRNDFATRRKSAPSAILQKPIFTTEQIVNEMEKEQDKIVLSLLREITILKYENSVVKQKLHSFMDTNAYQKFLLLNNIPVSSTANANGNVNGNLNSSSSSSSSPLPTKSNGISGINSNNINNNSSFLFPSNYAPSTQSISRQNSLSRSRFSSVATTAVGSSTNESTPFSSPLPSRRPSLNNHNNNNNNNSNNNNNNTVKIVTPISNSNSMTITPYSSNSSSSGTTQSSISNRGRRSSSVSSNGNSFAAYHLPPSLYSDTQPQPPKLSMTSVTLESGPSKRMSAVAGNTMKHAVQSHNHANNKNIENEIEDQESDL